MTARDRETRRFAGKWTFYHHRLKWPWERSTGGASEYFWMCMVHQRMTPEYGGIYRLQQEGEKNFKLYIIIILRFSKLNYLLYFRASLVAAAAINGGIALSAILQSDQLQMIAWSTEPVSWPEGELKNKQKIIINNTNVWQEKSRQVNAPKVLPQRQNSSRRYTGEIIFISLP